MNKKNLRKLKNHLKTIDPRTLRMQTFTDKDYMMVTSLRHANEINWCGTAACMVGHASTIFPFEDGDLTLYNINWSIYSTRVFGLERKIDELWWFLFGVCWSNSIPDAVNRIDYVLKHGSYPENYDDWEEFGWGNAFYDPKEYIKMKFRSRT